MKTVLHIITSLKKVEKKNIITSVVISQDSTFGLKQKISFTYLPKGNKHLALQSGVIDFPKMSADDFNKLTQAFNDYVFSSWKITNGVTVIAKQLQQLVLDMSSFFIAK